MKKIIFLLQLIIIQTLTASLPAPYQYITPLPEVNFPYWFRNKNKEILSDAIKRLKPRNIIEVGSWLGASTCFIASQLSESSKVYAIDHWLGGPAENKDPNYPVIRKIVPVLYLQFLSNVIHQKLCHKIVPIRMSSMEAIQALQHLSPELIYIDGSHQEDHVYQDIISWYKLLAPNGEMVGDDFDHPEVKRAVFRAEKTLNAKVIIHQTVWAIKKVP